MMAEPSPLPPPLAGRTRHRFLSPHYDDIALSCGGSVALLSGAGITPEIGVIFGDEPDPTAPHSPFAASMHQAWGLSAEEVIARRRQEEAAAARVLGASSRTLPFLDAIYRDRHYLSDEQLFGQVAAAETRMPARIAEAFAGVSAPKTGTRIYAPLGIGGHVDHQLGFAAAVELARAGWDVWFYEDLPYALNDGALERRLTVLDPGTAVEPAAIIPVSATWEQKLAAILAYGSQLATVFGYVGSGSDRAEIDAVLRRYAHRIGDGTAGERFWRLVGEPSRGSRLD